MQEEELEKQDATHRGEGIEKRNKVTRRDTMMKAMIPILGDRIFAGTLTGAEPFRCYGKGGLPPTKCPHVTGICLSH